MYIIKTKGTFKIPDFVQIRDENFILVNHFKLNNASEISERIDYSISKEKAEYINHKLPFGILYKL
ncbi:MAG: hypothetical protein A2W98_02305 [Bacteroidetes bacterium GWF2_33_38]|nr:MAG: hypothetical protein A2W98_02305 [Bacteroidetes bacterium GWF2_33_38]OFY75856.1 MAG: hypothetical protein A2265_02950 [Bacteroidetes bacterium RIFOXYA12_FULL_33_9]HBX51635.1 fructose-6-phosphate aldolase [Bacteroidales bacterium]